MPVSHEEGETRLLEQGFDEGDQHQIVGAHQLAQNL
jgi:hypothetical protein